MKKLIYCDLCGRLYQENELFLVDYVPNKLNKFLDTYFNQPKVIKKKYCSKCVEIFNAEKK